MNVAGTRCKQTETAQTKIEQYQISVTHKIRVKISVQNASRGCVKCGRKIAFCVCHVDLILVKNILFPAIGSLGL